jgi:agmatine deiminase
MTTPLEEGYSFPAEWEKHEATWLSYPHNEASFPGKMESVYPSYFEFVKTIGKDETVHLNLADEATIDKVTRQLDQFDVDPANVRLHIHPTNDAWCRDHGPAFLVNREAPHKKIIVNWEYNAWGGKYPHELDNQIPLLVAKYKGLPHVSPGIVMEGGSVDFNGKGTVLTTTSCLLNPNRNPRLNQEKIEEYLKSYYGVRQVLWLGDGIEGDDTDGHIDDITRFVSEDTVITVIEHDQRDGNYIPLKKNLSQLQKMKLHDGRPLQIIELPMPSAVYHEGQRLPASYANFYICNHGVIVPTFRCKEDSLALEIIGKSFPGRKVIGIDSVDIIWGLGSFHCLSQQEPLA